MREPVKEVMVPGVGGKGAGGIIGHDVAITGFMLHIQDTTAEGSGGGGQAAEEAFGDGGGSFGSHASGPAHSGRVVRANPGGEALDPEQAGKQVPLQPGSCHLHIRVGDLSLAGLHLFGDP